MGLIKTSALLFITVLGACQQSENSKSGTQAASTRPDYWLSQDTLIDMLVSSDTKDSLKNSADVYAVNKKQPCPTSHPKEDFSGETKKLCVNEDFLKRQAVLQNSISKENNADQDVALWGIKVGGHNTLGNFKSLQECVNAARNLTGGKTVSWINCKNR